MDRALFIVGVFTLSSLAFLPVALADGDDGPARKLLNSQGCKSCHTLEGDGGNVSASFESIRKRLTREEVRAQLANNEQKHGKGSIPDFGHLAKNEIEALVDFIQPGL